MKHKKGAEMTIGTIIVIVLALVVLVILVYGFSTGWTNLWDKITNFGGGKVNVQTVVQSCQLACTTSSSYDYCKTRSLIEDANADGKADTPRNVNCKVLESGNYGLSVCDITCVAVEKTCSIWNAKDVLCTADEKDITDTISQTDRDAHPNQKCCIKE